MYAEDDDVKHTDTTAATQEMQQEQATAGEPPTGTTPPERPNNATDPVTELQQKYDELNDKYLRLYSEFDNYRKRTAKEKLEMARNAGSQIFKELLPVMDDFDRAVAANETDPDIESIREGFKLIHHKLERILERHGVKAMKVMEEPFDTNWHEAITNIPAPTAELKGRVLDVAEKGYTYHDSILRYAKVIVGQ
jgi:molecular chaperone GrpE